MRVRSILLSSVLALSAVGTSQAYAAQMLKPQGNWAVTKVEAKTVGAAPYCALARRFGNGSIVTFARNSGNETSVAVDFPPGSFKSSQNYTIVLDPGSGESRSYKTQPISERGIVIRMGRDDKFYDALEQSGKLGVSVDDKSYTFSMSDMKSGTQDLSACLGTSVEPASGPQQDQPKEAAASPVQVPEAAPTPAPISKTQKMAEAVMPSRTAPAAGSSAIPTSDSDAQSLKEENLRLRNALERERRTYEDKMQQGDSSSTAAELSEKLQLLQSENAQLKDKLSNVKPVAGAVASTAAVGAGSVVAAAAAPMNCSGKVDDARFEGLKTENTELKAMLDAQKKQPAVDNTQVTALKAENTQLKADLDAQKKVVAPVAKADSKADDAAMTALKTENTQLKADLTSEQQKVAALETAQKTFVENKPLPTVNAANDALIATLKGQISKLETENSALKLADSSKPVAGGDQVSVASLAKMHGLEEELSQMKSDRDRLSNEIQTMKTVETGPQAKISSENWNLEQATQRYNEAEHEIQRLGSVVESERAKCIVEKKNIEYMLFDPKIANKQQIAKLVDLENQLADAKKGVDTSKVAANDKLVQDLKQQLASANDQIATMKKTDDQKVAVNDQSAVVDSMKQQLASSSDQISQLKKSLADAQTQKVAVNDQSAVVDSLKQEVASLNNQVANMQNEKAAAAQNLAHITPASGGNDSVNSTRLSAAPETVVPRPSIEVDTQAMNTSAPERPVSILPAPVQSTPLAPDATKKVASAVSAVTPVVVAPVTPVTAAPVQSIAASTQASNVKLMSLADVSGLLDKSGVKVSTPVTAVASSTGPGHVSYKWETAGLFGTAEQKSLDNAGQYDRYVQDYLDKTKSRCKGQFAAVPGMVNLNGGTRMSVYEIACVDEKSGDGASAAVVFYSQSGTFTTIAHEASSDSMDVAMDVRDKIVGTLDGTKTASR